MTKTFEIAGLEVEPGTKSRGLLRVGPYFHHKRAYIRRFVLIPYTVIRGFEEGPTLVQTAGCHPTEYSGIDSTIRLANDIQPEEIKGTFIAVPCVNTPGFYERTYINPIDGKNVQAVYPGRLDGTISDMMAYRVFHDFMLKADYFLDCHGSDIHESNSWMFLYYQTGGEVDKKSEAIARASGIIYLEPSTSSGAGMELAKRGIAGGIFELCSGDRLLPEESSAIYNATHNIMYHLGMMEGEPIEIKNQPGTTEGQEQEFWVSGPYGMTDNTVYFTKSGLYHTKVQRGDLVEEGQVLGTVTDLWGEVIETIRAPVTGRIFITVHNPLVREGDIAYSVAVPRK